MCNILACNILIYTQLYIPYRFMLHVVTHYRFAKTPFLICLLFLQDELTFECKLDVRTMHMYAFHSSHINIILLQLCVTMEHNYTYFIPIYSHR